MKERTEDQNTNSPFEAEEIPLSKPRKRRRILKAFIVTFVIVIGLALLTMGGIMLVLSPQRLTPIVNKYASEYLNATVKIDTVRLSFFSDFPFLRVAASHGTIISHAFNDLPDSVRMEIPTGAADTLLRFRLLAFSTNMYDLLAGKIAVRRGVILEPDLYAFVAPNGKTNWDILPATDTIQTESEPFVFSTGRLGIPRGGQIRYESRPDSMNLLFNLERLSLSGDATQRYDIELAGQATACIDTIHWCDTLPIALKGGIKFDPASFTDITLTDFSVAVNEMPVMLDGNILIGEDSIHSNLICRVESLALSRLISTVPPHLYPPLRELETNLTLGLNTHIRGSYHYASGRLPIIELDCKVNEGYLFKRESRARIERLAIDASMMYHPYRPDSTGLEVRKLILESPGIQLHGEVQVRNAIQHPVIKGEIDGEINLDTLSVLFPSSRGIVGKGKIGIEAHGNFHLHDLNPQLIGKTDLHGHISMENFLLDMPQDTIRIMAGNGLIHFGSTEHEADSIIGRDQRQLHFSMQVDTFHVNFKNELILSAQKTNLSMYSAASVLSGDTTRIHPFTGTFNSHFFVLNTIDSLIMRFYRAKSNFSILPAVNNPLIPQLRLALTSRATYLRRYINRGYVMDNTIELEATLTGSRRAIAARREQMLDSLQRVYPAIERDSLFAHIVALRRAERQANEENTEPGSGERRINSLRRRMPGGQQTTPNWQPGEGRSPNMAVGPQRQRNTDDFSSEDFDMTVSDDIGALLRRWNVQGSIRGHTGRVVTPYFPLTNYLDDIDIDFTTNEVNFNNTRVRAGQSDLNLTGNISNIRRTLMGYGDLEINLNVISDTLNFNELVQAAYAGLAHADASEEYQQALREASSEEEMQQVIEEQTGNLEEQSTLLIVPGNVDLAANLEVRYGIYADLVLHRMTGALISRDRCLQINGLEAKTDAGDMQLTALYATRSKQDITTGFDLELKRLQVEKLIDLIPSVDTLLPMLRSFEGVVDCQMAATAALDTSMNILLPTLSAAARLQGENLVLLDGETFTEISKMLKFKNRERNQIDKISVEMLVHENQIELFPFILEMDRYQTAISGIQKLDLSFNYHISVLRSPIPFRLGINVSGTLDKYKIRLGKAKYKSANIPSYVELIDTTRINLRSKITDIFQRGIEAAGRTELSIVPLIDTVSILATEPTAEDLSATDSIALQNLGVIEVDSTAVDSIQIIQEETTVTESRRERRAARRAEISSDNPQRSRRERKTNDQNDTGILPEEN